MMKINTKCVTGKTSKGFKAVYSEVEELIDLGFEPVRNMRRAHYEVINGKRYLVS